MAHFLCHLGCSHFGALLLDFYFTENIQNHDSPFRYLPHKFFYMVLFYAEIARYILLVKVTLSITMKECPA